MPEAPHSIEAAHMLHEHGLHGAGHGKGERRFEALEILEAILLALIAISTAWSGYQASRWDGRSAERYAAAAAFRIEQDEAETLAGQQRLSDIATFNAWLQAVTTRDEPAAQLLERRFSLHYRAAFEAWLKTDPLKNPAAPPGPLFMPEYRNPQDAEARELGRKADAAMQEGIECRETGEDHTRVTVFLATVLFLIAVSQRFRHRETRLALVGLAVVFTGIAIFLILTYPKA